MKEADALKGYEIVLADLGSAVPENPQFREVMLNKEGGAAERTLVGAIGRDGL